MTLVIPYYEAPQMLREQLKHWYRYKEWDLKIVLIDDGSQRYPASEVLKGLDHRVELYRIEDNIPWNYVGARNLGHYVAEDGWVFSTDLDHVISTGEMDKLLRMESKLDLKCFYRPRRFHATMIQSDYPRHNSTYIMTRAAYWTVGGYNEDFAGFYGGATGPFRKELNRKYKCVELDVSVLHYQGVIEDASVSDWGRKNSSYYYKNNPELVRKSKELMRNYQAPNPMRFTWKKVEHYN